MVARTRRAALALELEAYLLRSRDGDSPAADATTSIATTVTTNWKTTTKTM
ncbi:hypothetical protein ACHAW5_001413 [Stephanodiscus triporus]|uniref:Uncharacterized protein n=1 Tax=Stephanodiscus triporus TaxID=2934178 RepID=A0ABD3NNY2_9STRA